MPWRLGEGEHWGGEGHFLEESVGQKLWKKRMEKEDGKGTVVRSRLERESWFITIG